MKLNDKSKPVLVTGTNGYIGIWITKELLDNNYTVHVTVREIYKTINQTYQIIF